MIQNSVHFQILMLQHAHSQIPFGYLKINMRENPMDLDKFTGKSKEIAIFIFKTFKHHLLIELSLQIVVIRKPFGEYVCMHLILSPNSKSI